MKLEPVTRQPKKSNSPDPAYNFRYPAIHSTMAGYFKALLNYPAAFGPLNVEDLKEVRHPFAELSWHYSLRGMQLGAFIGTVLGTAVVLSTPATRSVARARQFITRYGGRGLLAGLISGPTVTGLTVETQSLNYDEIAHRCFLIRNDHQAMRIESYTLFGCLICHRLAKYANMPGIYGIVLGMWISVAFGTIVNIKHSYSGKDRRLFREKTF